MRGYVTFFFFLSPLRATIDFRQINEYVFLCSNLRVTRTLADRKKVRDLRKFDVAHVHAMKSDAQLVHFSTDYVLVMRQFPVYGTELLGAYFMTYL